VTGLEVADLVAKMVARWPSLERELWESVLTPLVYSDVRAALNACTTEPYPADIARAGDPHRVSAEQIAVNLAGLERMRTAWANRPKRPVS
jgi:hypothetical protein